MATWHGHLAHASRGHLVRGKGPYGRARMALRRTGRPEGPLRGRPCHGRRIRKRIARAHESYRLRGSGPDETMSASADTACSRDYRTERKGIGHACC